VGRWLAVRGWLAVGHWLAVRGWLAVVRWLGRGVVGRHCARHGASLEDDNYRKRARRNCPQPPGSVQNCSHCRDYRPPLD
jgi:hypothetical protein